MAVNLEAILGMRNLVGLIQSVVSRVPEDLLPEAMYKSTRSIEGNRGTYFKVRGTRQTARVVQYGGPSRARELPGVSEEPLTLLHTFEHCIHNAALLQNLAAETQNDSNSEIKQRLGLETITRQIEVFGDLFRNLRVSAIYSALATGYIYFDSQGNLLPTSTGSAYSVNYGIPVNTATTPETPYANIGTWNTVLGTGSLNTGWNTLNANTGRGTADIQGQILQLKNLARQRTGYEITHAFYGKSILTQINNNAVVQQVLTGSARYSEAAMMTEIPDGTFGIKKWYPVVEAFFTPTNSTTYIPLGTDEASSIKEWFPASQITFTPTPSPEWWEVVEGTYPVPAAFNITKDMMGQLASLKQIAGPFSYATLQDDPVSVKHLAGDTFLPVIKVPGSVFIINTTGP